MQINLRIGIWNANGITNKRNEIEFFLNSKHIDIFLISETHLTSRSYIKIKGYDFVYTNHPDDKAHAGAGLFIKSTIRYDIAEEYSKNFLQAAGVKITCNNMPINIYSIYFPPRHNVKLDDYEHFFNRLGPRFIAAGDYNAKHPWWGSRLSNPKGKQLFKCLNRNNFNVLSGGRPTYWPSDPNKIPDVLDFAVYNGISRYSLDILNEEYLSSDHTPIIMNYNVNVELSKKQFKIITRKTNLNMYREKVEENINLNLDIKTGDELDDAVEQLNLLIHEAARLSTPVIESHEVGLKVRTSAIAKDMIRQSRRLRRIWHRTRNPRDKANWNLAIKLCSDFLAKEKNDSVGQYLKKLTPHNHNSDYHLYNATKYLKRPTKRNVPIRNTSGIWCKTDAQKSAAFAEHLEKIFTPHDINSNDRNISHSLDVACQMELPIKFITINETIKEINNLNIKKSTGYDNIDAKAIRALPKKGVLFLTLLYNSILRLQHFPSQWKCAEIIMVLKPGKPENELSSYRPISLLPIFSKIFERILMKRLNPFLEKNNIIPEHQFGFRSKHGTPEQCHRVVKEITNSLEDKKYCTAVFLDIQQAFDKVWHIGLLHKLKSILPAPFYVFFLSYLRDRVFYVKTNNDVSQICQIKAGIPQGSVLGPVLYTLFTYDMPINDNVTVATYADDTAFLCSDHSPVEASRILQLQLNKIEIWLTTWKIVVNAQKSSNITFTLRKMNCPPVFLNKTEIPSRNVVKYLGIHLDRRLTWRSHVVAKRKQLDLKYKQMYWLLGPKSELSLENKVLLLKTILKPIWTYGIQLWGTTSNSNIEILQRFQSKTLRSITNAPFYVTNVTLHRDLDFPFIKSEIKKFSSNYLQRLSNHTNTLAITLLDDTDEIRRLKRKHVLDLPFT